MSLLIPTAQQMEQLGAKLYDCLPETCIVFLEGNLGAGKTTLVRGFLHAAGYTGPVKSPTYNLVEEYQLNGRHVCHFDFYRLSDPEELEWMGIRDYFIEPKVCFIEWPQRGLGFLPKPDLLIELSCHDQSRSADFTCCDPKNIKLNFNMD